MHKIDPLLKMKECYVSRIFISKKKFLLYVKVRIKFSPYNSEYLRCGEQCIKQLNPYTVEEKYLIEEISHVEITEMIFTLKETETMEICLLMLM